MIIVIWWFLYLYQCVCFAYNNFIIIFLTGGNRFDSSEWYLPDSVRGWLIWMSYRYHRTREFSFIVYTKCVFPHFSLIDVYILIYMNWDDDRLRVMIDFFIWHPILYTCILQIYALMDVSFITLNSFGPGRFERFVSCNFQANFNDWRLRYILWNCPPLWIFLMICQSWFR